MMSLSDSSVTQSLKPMKVEEVFSCKALPPPTLPRIAALSNGEVVVVVAAVVVSPPPAPPKTPPVDAAVPAAFGERPPGGVRVDEVDGPGD